MDAEWTDRTDPQAPSASPSGRSGRAIVGPAIGLIRAHGRTLLRTAGLVALAGAVPVAILADFVRRTVGDEVPLDAMPPAAMAGQLLAGLMQFLLSLLVLVVAFQVLLGMPRPLEMRRPLGAMGSYLLSVAAVAVPLGMVGLLAWGLATVAGPSESTGVLVLFFILMTVGVVASVFVITSLSLSMILVIREDLPVMAALRTSWRRMPGHRLRLMGGQIVVGLLALPMLLLASFLVGWLPTFAAVLVFTACNSLASAVVVGAVATVVYTDTLPPQPAGPLNEPAPTPRV